jgi:hypothetical protein
VVDEPLDHRGDDDLVAEGLVAGHDERGTP